MMITALLENALTLAPESNAAETIRTMVDRKLDLGVVLVQKHPQGLVTEKELVEQLAARPDTDAAGMVVSDVMRPLDTAPTSIAPVDAARLMRERKAHHLAVIDDDGTFVGIVGLRRVLLEVMDEQELKLDNLERELMADGPGG